MDEFTIKLFQLTLFLFDKTDNIIVFVPTFVLVWCAAWAIIGKLVRSL